MTIEELVKILSDKRFEAETTKRADELVLEASALADADFKRVQKMIRAGAEAALRKRDLEMAATR